MSRVLLHSLVFSPDGVSTAYIMTDLAIELKLLGHSVTVLTTTPHYNINNKALEGQPMKKHWLGLLYYSECGGIPVWHVKLPIKGSRVWARAVDYVRFHILSLIASLYTIGPQDVVIATSPPLTIGVISWLLGLRWHAPSVYKVAEVYPDLAIRQGVIRGKIMIGITRWLEQLVYSRSAMIVPIADQFCDVIRGRGVPDQKLLTIPDFVDTDLYRPLPRDNPFAKKHGLLEDFIVLYGGNVGIVQDWESVLFAAETLSSLPVRFVIVGDGARWAWLSDEIAKRGLQNVKLLGYQSKDLMPQINASCDIAIIPMTRTGAQDGFPSKIYTNLASARPVIVSADQNAEMATIVKRVGCGRVVPPEYPQAFADAVLSAFRERELLPAEGERGRKFVEKDYSKEAIALKYDALINQLIGR
ncbi:glycosyltransferase WbuB [Candidatus Parcubacteria bacterium]|nr:MAG: glycosyltransferase WbuB [Candidatus Parcubacteria bacterium]